MPALTNSIVTDAPAEAVWQVVAHHFDRIGDWATAIPASTAQSVQVSMVDAPVAGRICHTGIRAVPHVTETIIAYDEDARTLTRTGVAAGHRPRPAPSGTRVAAFSVDVDTSHYPYPIAPHPGRGRSFPRRSMTWTGAGVVRVGAAAAVGAGRPAHGRPGRAGPAQQADDDHPGAAGRTRRLRCPDDPWGA
jgi:hypothetical protein